MPEINRARALRRKSTWAEKLVWRWLRDRRFSAYKFRRQHPVGIYTLDFYCREAALSIELDGGNHGHPAKQASDAGRTRFLASMGIKELRFWNSQLLKDRQAIRDTIFRELQMRAPHLLPKYTEPAVPSGRVGEDG
jgi:very-short-patch-repair endonuclease